MTRSAKIKFIGVLIGSFFVTSAVWAAPSKLELDPSQSEITFYGTSATHKFEGTSRVMRGVLDVDLGSESLLKGASITIPIQNFVTGNQARDHAMQHMFEMGKFPDIIFEVNKINRLTQTSKASGSRKRYQLDGILKIHDISQPVSLEVEALFSDKGVEVTGEKSLTTEMFGLKAPVMLGIFRVDKEVKVGFKTIWKNL